MYQALYRKWRPATFSDVVGQQAITTALQNQILADKIGHAYLFTGTRGTGKTTCSKIFAKAVNCENLQQANPCGECVPCKGIEDSSILDVLEIDAASNNGVDDVRDLRDETAYRPARCRYKVYIIDEVHMLSTQAFNALLKIMEEPPDHVLFILATTEIHKVPATILSRCQRYDFARIPPELMADRLRKIAQQEGISLTESAADLIARLADGALRDAISLLDVCAGAGGEVDEALVRRMAGVADKSYLFSLSQAAQANDTAGLLQKLEELREQSIDTKRLAEELARHYRNLLLAAAQPDGSLLVSLPRAEREQYSEAATLVGERKAIYGVRRLAAALDRMGRSPDPRIELELALFDIAAPPQQAAVKEVPVQPGQPAAAAVPVATKPRGETGEGEGARAVAAPPVPPVQGGEKAAEANHPVATEQPEQEKDTAPVAVPNASQKTTQLPGSLAVAVEEPHQAAARALQAEETFPQAVDVAPQDAQDAAVAGHSTQEKAPSAQKEELPAMAGQGAGAGGEFAEAGEALSSADGTVQVATAVPQPLAEPTAPVPFEHWPQVVAKMSGIDRMLYSYMKGSSAYTDGRRVLISGGDMFLTYMRQYEEASERIKTVIEQVTGTRYAIGPYKEQADAGPKMATAQDTLREWEALGVPIEYE